MGGCIGVVAGLVAITPAAGFVTTSTALLIGVAAGIICNFVARVVKNKFKLDDTLDVFACHGIGGAIGVTMTGLLSTTAVNSAGANGLMHGESKLFIANLVGLVAVAAYAMVCTFVIIKVVSVITPLRVTDSEENTGLDMSQHGETIGSV
jgi:Amt family ammonium transporter